MARTPSKMIPLGTQMKDFELIEPLSGKKIAIAELSHQKDATLIMFICNHCPFVKHIQEGLLKLAEDYIKKNIAFVGINSNDVQEHPEDSPEKMKEEPYNFPYLFDETQQVARLYEASCTPDFFLFDKNKKLAYRGQMDDSRPGNGISVTGKDLREAMGLLLEGKLPSANQKPSIGCNIKWKS